MSYLNQFIICEDDQFECSGVFKINADSNVNQVEHSLENYFEKDDGNLILNHCFRK